MNVWLDLFTQCEQTLYKLYNSFVLSQFTRFRQWLYVHVIYYALIDYM